VISHFGILDVNYFLQRLSRSEKVALFTWRSRMNCYFCFFQQIWEWVGLLEHHPDLFDQAEKIENEVGAKDYTWRQEYSLAKIREESETIKARRAKRVAHKIFKIMGIKTAPDYDENEEDGLAVVSCGLLCGK